MKLEHTLFNQPNEQKEGGDKPHFEKKSAGEGFQRGAWGAEEGGAGRGRGGRGGRGGYNRGGYNNTKYENNQEKW